MVLTKSSMRRCSWLKANLEDCIQSYIFKVAIVMWCFFSKSSFSKQCMHVHWVSGCRTHRSHIFSGRVPWRGALGWVLSLTQLCRRFTRVMVTRLTTKLHCEMYLTPSLESVQQGLINVRLMVMSPNTVKYLPDHYLLCPCLSNDPSTNRYELHCLHEATQPLECVSWPGGCEPRGPFHSNSCAKVDCFPPRGALDSVTTEATLQWWAGSGPLEVQIPPGMDVDAGIPLCLDRGSHGWVKMQVRGPEQPRWDHPWVLSLTFPLRRSGAWAICLSAVSIWGKLAEENFSILKIYEKIYTCEVTGLKFNYCSGSLIR